jgi:hypothetical protein
MAMYRDYVGERKAKQRWQEERTCMEEECPGILEIYDRLPPLIYAPYGWDDFKWELCKLLVELKGK